jgi:nucleotide-binding universal stress UspA family protein
MTTQELQTKPSSSNGEWPNIRKITLALDGSESSLQACAATAIVANGFKSTVTAVYVLPKLKAVGQEPVPDEVTRKSIGTAMSMLASYEGVVAKSEILEARSLSISEALVDYVGREKSDLIVSGNRGLGGFERLLLGSVSSSLVAHSPCSVLVVRSPTMVDNKAAFSRVLVATDGSKSASKAVLLSIGLAKVLPLKLTFVHTIYFPPMTYSVGAGGWFQTAMEEARADGRRITSEAQALAKKYGVDSDTKVLDEMLSPVDTITKLAEVEKYDLIAVGTRGLGGFKRLALGSVASGIVHYAHCSVLVAK